MDYRKICLNLVSEILRENIEQRFSVTTYVDKMADETILEGWPKDQEIAYKKFIKGHIARIAKEVYTEQIDVTMEKIMIDMASISMIFSDDEMKQIYEITKSPLGMKIIRNLDIMRFSIRDGLFLMGNKMVERWRSPENQKEIENFLIKIERGKK